MEFEEGEQENREKKKKKKLTHDLTDESIMCLTHKSNVSTHSWKISHIWSTNRHNDSQNSMHSVDKPFIFSAMSDQNDTA